MLKNMTIRKYLGNMIDDDITIKELMTNMSITTLPVDKIFKITGVLSPEELYNYIINPLNHALLAEIGFNNNENYQYPKVKSTKRSYHLDDEQALMGTSVEDIMYEEVLPSKVFYKKKDRN